MTRLAVAEPLSDLERKRALVILLLISTMGFVDRSIINTVGQAIKVDLDLTDLQLGILGGPAFAILYGVCALPVARLTEHHSRLSIISIFSGIWSFMTVLCGFATSFFYLCLARIGVGIGEAGAIAPVQSYLADCYPPHKRATAIGLLGLSNPLGLVLGGLAGAIVAEAFGWRTAFFLAGGPGILFAIIAVLAMREPPRGHLDVIKDMSVPSTWAVVKRLMSLRSYRHILTGMILGNLGGFGLQAFLHPYLVRAFGFSYSGAAVAFALIFGISVTAAYLMGGTFCDRLARRDLRWYMWLPAIGSLIGGVLWCLGFLLTKWQFAIPFLMIPGIFSAAFYAPCYAVTQNIVSSRMRATAIAIVATLTMLIGMALGPVVAGAISDFAANAAFTGGDFVLQCAAGRGTPSAACHAASVAGLRASLCVFSLIFCWAGIHYIFASRHIAKELTIG